MPPPPPQTTTTTTTMAMMMMITMGVKCLTDVFLWDSQIHWITVWTDGRVFHQQSHDWENRRRSPLALTLRSHCDGIDYFPCWKQITNEMRTRNRFVMLNRSLAGSEAVMLRFVLPLSSMGGVNWIKTERFSSSLCFGVIYYYLFCVEWNRWYTMHIETYEESANVVIVSLII